MKVDRSQFEAIIENLLGQKPVSRENQKTGTRKSSGTIIAPKPSRGPQSTA